ncbi:hypothetical protein TNIN_285691 [Trichonephila inaurata madagascariensis]|uniref:Uncharacterized protein n=1 Tax=Trichonephila inaurata madagascariensis TaxID=2747483 RepID=A0A8X7CJ90_9ARAC|nr:hypothetical protein TNIN_285691 [Trichonephila inaurata madagascariensis]
MEIFQSKQTRDSSAIGQKESIAGVLQIFLPCGKILREPLVTNRKSAKQNQQWWLIMQDVCAPAFCKHVFAVMYAVEDYSSAPTERLQILHQPKPCKTLPLCSIETFGKSQNQRKNIKIDEKFK